VESLVSAQPVALAVPPEPPAPLPAATPPAREQFSFTGQAGEYFGIWIVNLFLSIVTLGIYSAWAKVRRKRYFYGNTWVGGANFDYHAQPVSILKGRLIAFAAFASYTVAGHFSPKLAAAIALAIMPLLPWFLVRSFAFNAVNSSHRNLRFHFRAGYREALRAVGALVVVPLFGFFMPEAEDMGATGPEGLEWFTLFAPTLAFFVVYPYVVAQLALLRVNHSRFGAAPFASRASVAQFYWVYIFAATLVAGVAGLLWAAMTPLFLWSMGFFAFVPVIYVVLGAILFGYTQSRIGNLVFGSTRLDGRVQFVSTLSARRLAWIYATNAAAIVCSLGLAIPWAVIRTARYRADRLALECEGGLEAFAADVARHVGAAGEELGEMFDVDLSL
jgi:uncharacterized membrane protein YjgN (DUF898 family)